jgi:hypothetical protein
MTRRKELKLKPKRIYTEAELEAALVEQPGFTRAAPVPYRVSAVDLKRVADALRLPPEKT